MIPVYIIITVPFAFRRDRNALVVCNHPPPLPPPPPPPPPPPRPEEGRPDSLGNERGFDQSFATAVREIPGVCFIYAKRAVNEKIADCGEKTAVVLPTSSPRRMGLLAGICWTKSQSPRYSPGLEGGVGDCIYK